MLQLARLLLLFVTCLGLLGMPVRMERPCCEPETAEGAATHGASADACVCAPDHQGLIDDGATARVANNPCSDPVSASVVPPALAEAKTAERFQLPPARGPPSRDPNGLLQVPKAS